MGQKKKNVVSLAVMAAVAGALVAYAYFGVMAPEEQKTAQKEANERLFATSGDGEADGGAHWTVRRITVEAKGDSTTLERREGKWWIVSPVEALADPIVADSVSSQLQNAKFKSVIDEQPTPADLAKYGLEKPSFTVSAMAELGEGKEKQVTLRGGIENTFDGSIYMQRDDSPTVWSAEGGVRYSFDKSTFELRDKEPLALEVTKLSRAEVKHPGASFTLARAEDGKAWKLTQPTEEPADTATVSALLESLKSARASEFFEDSPERRKQFGLTAPEVEVIAAREGKPEPVRIALARVKGEDGEERVYALREEGSRAMIAEVSDAALTGLKKSPAELRDRSVLRFSRDAVAELSFTQEGGGAEVIVKRTQSADAGVAEEWSIVAPEKSAAGKWKLSSVLWSLGALKASELGELDKAKGWETYGLTEEARAITLKDEAGKVLAALKVGAESKEKPGSFWVRGTRDVPLLVDGARLAELPDALSDVAEASN